MTSVLMLCVVALEPRVHFKNLLFSASRPSYLILSVVAPVMICIVPYTGKFATLATDIDVSVGPTCAASTVKALMVLSGNGSGTSPSSFSTSILAVPLASMRIFTPTL